MLEEYLDSLCFIFKSEIDSGLGAHHPGRLRRVIEIHHTVLPVLR